MDTGLQWTLCLRLRELELFGDSFEQPHSASPPAEPEQIELAGPSPAASFRKLGDARQARGAIPSRSTPAFPLISYPSCSGNYSQLLRASSTRQQEEQRPQPGA